MREGSVTTQDLEVQAAKEKLGTIAEREGYVEAMKPSAKGSDAKTMVRVMIVLAAIFVAVIVLGELYVAQGWPRWVMRLVFGVLTLLALLAALGAGQETTPVPWPVVVMSKLRNPRGGDVPELVVMLLDEAGALTEAWTFESTFDLLRPGDLGVAHVRRQGTRTALVSFVRL